MHMQNNYASPLDRHPIVVKYGGNALPAEDQPADLVLAEIAGLAADGTPVVLVHGGGPEIDRWLRDRGRDTERIDGLRVTDSVTLEVTEAVLCGTLNKRIVRGLAALGVHAVGISGEDGATITAEPSANRALGFVGDACTSDPRLVLALLQAGYVPVVAPLAMQRDAATALNVNADLAAAALAAALHAHAFVMITNVSRVLRNPPDPASAIDRLTVGEARAFAASPSCSGGMRPKIDAAVAAVTGGARAAYICGTSKRTIATAVAGAATIITA